MYKDDFELPDKKSIFKKRDIDIEKAIQKNKIETKLQKEISTAFTAFSAIFLAIIFLYAASVAYDIFKLTVEGYATVPNEGYAILKEKNEDLVAWLTMEGTHIDHPIVQGKDNFEYLSINFYKQEYVGGSLFLDCENKKDFSDSYNIIHGHHMSLGAMFGDLHLYLDKEFWNEHTSGELKTPYGNYNLKVIGATEINAYDNILVPRHFDKKKVKRACSLWRGTNGKRFLALVTCTSSLNDTRTVVFCEMNPNGEVWE